MLLISLSCVFVVLHLVVYILAIERNHMTQRQQEFQCAECGDVIFGQEPITDMYENQLEFCSSRCLDNAAERYWTNRWSS